MTQINKILDIRIRRKIRGIIGNKYKIGESDKELDRKIFKWLYFGLKLLDEEQLNIKMLNKLKEKEPFMFARLGMTEANITGEYIEKILGIRKCYDETWISWLYRTSGFFGDRDNIEADVDKYARLTLDAVENTDFFACWQPLYVDYIAKHYAYKADLFKYNKITGHAVNSIVDNHWSKGLEGRKVLVISSFPISIEKQYTIKDKLCTDIKRSLPDFELITYKAPETEMGINTYGFDNWFEVFEDFKKRVLDIDFEVALIGCGAYGYPLADAVKKSGRTAIELCGSVTKLFGIYGRGIERRWEKELDSWKTEYWIRPIDSPPECYQKIERAYYW